MTTDWKTSRTKTDQSQSVRTFTFGKTKSHHHQVHLTAEFLRHATIHLPRKVLEVIIEQ